MQQSEEDYDDGPELEIVEAPSQVSGNSKNKKARRASKVRPDYWREILVVDYCEGRLESSAAQARGSSIILAQNTIVSLAN